jgi:HD superfamily phosphodiesterase
MQKKLTIKEAEKLMRKYLKDKPKKLYHSIKVSKFGYQVAKKIKQNHPELDIDLKEVRILGLLHDIGRGNSEWVKHFFETGRILRTLGLNYYAEKTETHGPAPEVAKHFKIIGDYYPKTIEEEILSYADAHYKNNKFVTVKTRFSDAGFKRLEKKYPLLAKKITKDTFSRRIDMIKKV